MRSASIRTGSIQTRAGPDRLSLDHDAGHDLTGPEFDALHAFLRRAYGPDSDEQARTGPVRVGLLGPVTLALTLVAAGLEQRQALDLARQLTERRSAALLAAVRERKPTGVVAVVMSEPGMVGASHPTFPLSPTQTRSLLDPVVDALDLSPCAGELIIGVHVPGRTDWATIVSSGISLISTPADSGLVGWSSLVTQHLERGGWIAWGAVPVDQPLGTTEELLWRRLATTWCDLASAGVDPMLVRLRSMVGPADGLAHFGLSQAERVVELVDSISLRVHRQTIGARLSLGA